MATDDSSSTLLTTDATAHQSTNVSDNATVPTVEELTQKNAALHQGMDQANIAKKKLEDQLLLLKQEVDQIKSGTVTKDKKEKFLTKEDLWEYENRDKISLANDEYKKYRGLEIEQSLALRLALDDKGIKSDKALHEHMRQAQMSSAPSSLDRSGGQTEERSDVARQVDDRMGISSDDRKKYGPRVAEMLKGMSFNF